MPDPGEDYQCWSTIADDNGDVDILIDWHEGQARRTVNNSSRSELAAHAKNRDLNNGSIITTGLPNAQAFLSGVNYLTIPTGMRATLKVGPGLTNDGPVTLACDGTDPVEVKLPTLLPCKGGEFTTSRYVDLLFDGTFWIFLYSAGNFAPLDSPVFTGDPQAPTAPPNDADNSIATTAFVMEAIFGGTGIVLGQKVFAAPGTFTYTPAAGTKAVIIECIGGGGAGAGGNGQAGINFAFPGGGSGGYSRKYVTGTDIGVSQSVTVGAGGIGAATEGPTGGDTFVGVDFATCLCGAHGGGGGSSGGLTAGKGGDPGVGDVAAAGAPGRGGMTVDSSAPIYGGVAGPPNQVTAGEGGSSIFGGGGFTPWSPQNIAVTGGAGRNYGAGGGGALADEWAAPAIGGSGSAGVIIITEFSGSGAVGPAGPIGPVGPQGPIGATGPSGPGTGDVLRSGTPVNLQIAQWTDASHIKGIDATTLTAGFAPLASPVLTGNPTAPTPTPLDADTSIATTGFVATAIGAIAGGGGGDVPTAGRLTFVSATQLKFAPCNGRRIQINGTQYNISTTGILGLANTSVFVNGTGSSSLAANTTFYVYAFVSGGTVTGDFRTDGNGHITDTTSGNVGVEVRCSAGTTPDPTRTLIGMCRTNATSQFADDAANRLVISWFNRRLIQGTSNFTTNRTTSSGPYVELHAEIRTNFLTWGDEDIISSLAGSAVPTTAATYIQTGLAFDGTTPSITSSHYHGSASYAHNMATGGTFRLAEGFHYVTLVGSTNGGISGQWYAAEIATQGTSTCRTFVGIRG